MATLSWATAVSGDWNVAADWTGGVVPILTDDAVIDAPATVAPGYTVTIAAGETETVNSLSMNAVNNIVGVNSDPYKAASLELAGTLAFGPTSAGLLGGSLQTVVHVATGANAAIVNGGTLNGFIQVEGNLTLTGKNGVYITNDLQALAGTVTVNTPIAELTGTALFDGIFDAKGDNALIQLGGAGNTVDIASIEGPPDNLDGWTELSLNGAGAAINEWNGTGYVSVLTTLADIKGGGTLDLMAGQNYTFTNALSVDADTLNRTNTTIAAGLLNLEAGTVAIPNLKINGGVVQGFGTITGAVVNTGTLMAVSGATTAGTLVVGGSLTGTGSVQFDFDRQVQQPGTLNTIGATLEVHAVAAGQTIRMNGDDTLQLDTPSAFLGTVSAALGDKIVLAGESVTKAVISGSSLVLSNSAGTQIGTIALSGSYANEAFTPTTAGGNTTLTLATATTTVTPVAPVAEFDAAYYLAHNPDVAAAGVDPAQHYATVGWTEGRNPDAYFNTDYYLNQNPDVAAAGIDPLTQYEEYGYKEGRDPSADFSTSAYLQANPDVAVAGIDPLLHYLEYGAPEGRMAFIAQPHGVGEQNPLVDNTYYFAQNPDVRAAGVNPFTHYDISGWHEGRNPDALFNTTYYLQQNPDVAAAGIDPLLHYEQYGWLEGRNPSADFSTTAYLNANQDVKTAGIDPLVHYEEFGMQEGRAIYHV